MMILSPIYKGREIWKAKNYELVSNLDGGSVHTLPPNRNAKFHIKLLLNM